MPHVDLPQAEFKVVLLGDTFTGKTSLVLRFAEGYYRESARSPTVGAFFITKRLSVPSVGLTCKIQIWDTAGQEQFKPLAPMYYQSAAAAIVCFDVTRPASVETLKYWLEELHQNVPAGRIVIALAACKCDQLAQGSDAVRQQRKQSLQQVEELAAQMGAIFVPTSAKSNHNVTQLFQQVAERVLQFQKQNKANSSNNKNKSNSNNIPVTLNGSNNSQTGEGYSTPPTLLYKSVRGTPPNSGAMPSPPLVPRNSSPQVSLLNNNQKQQQSSSISSSQQPSSPANSLQYSVFSQSTLGVNSHMSNNNNNNNISHNNNNNNPSDPSQPHPHSPSGGSTMSREEYLHRRQHHHQPLTPAIDADDLLEKPVKYNTTTNMDDSTTHAAGGLCGDTDILTCAALSSQASAMHSSTACVIL